MGSFCGSTHPLFFPFPFKKNHGEWGSFCFTHLSAPLLFQKLPFGAFHHSLVPLELSTGFPFEKLAAGFILYRSSFS